MTFKDNTVIKTSNGYKKTCKACKFTYYGDSYAAIHKFFYRDLSTPTGYAYNCNECAKTKQKKYNESKKKVI